MALPHTSAVILAAGKSTRMRSKLPKGLHPLCGRAVLEHIVQACFDAGIEDVIVVVGYQADEVKKRLGDRVRYVHQEVPKGTGDALKCARPAVAEDCRLLFVLPGDAPLVTGADLSAILIQHESEGHSATVVTAVLEDAKEYGRIIREEGRLRIVETKGDQTPPEIRAIHEFNTAVYLFDPALVFPALECIGDSNAQGEYFLTDVIETLSRETGRCGAFVAPDARIWLGVNTREELAEAGSHMRRRILSEHMKNGVTLVDPAATYIDATVKIGQDTTIHPGTHLQGNTVIGENCDVGPFAFLTDAVLGDGVSVIASQITGSRLGDGTRCGPWSHLRPGCAIGKKVKLGNFVEINRSTVEDGVSIGHVSYLGDATLGEKTNIGAGTITCNYDGKLKHPTVIGRGVFIGSHATLVAPVTVGDGAYTAAGSVITADVPSDALAVGRSRQVVKTGWAARRRQDLAAGVNASAPSSLAPPDTSPSE